MVKLQNETVTSLYKAYVRHNRLLVLMVHIGAGDQAPNALNVCLLQETYPSLHAVAKIVKILRNRSFC